MSHIESTLKQFALLSGMSMILIQPTMAAGAIQASTVINRTAAQPEQIVVVSSKQKKHSKTAEEKFVFTFSVPINPAIEQ